MLLGLMTMNLLEGVMLLSYLAVRVICDHVSGRSKGYGFVRFTSETTATIALKEMHDQVNLLWHDIIYLCLTKSPVKGLISNRN